MSDWTSGFQAFNQGMGMLADANERKRRQAVEDERLTLERDRAKREGDRAAIETAILGLKKGAIDKSLESPTIPSGLRVKTGVRNEFGGTDYTFERKPEPLQVLDINGRQVLYDPNAGSGQEMKPNYLDMFLGKPAPTVAPPALPALPAVGAALEGTTPTGTPSIQSPKPSVEAPMGVAPGGASVPGWRIGNVGPSGPTLEPVYPTKKPEIVNLPLPNGGTGMFMRTFDPKTDEEKLTPYNQPESANKISEKTITLQNLNAARRYAKELKDAIARSGTYETRFGNTDDAATLNQNPYLMAIAMAKVLDPGSVAREGEVNAAKKFLVPLGMTESSDVSSKSIDKLLNDLNTRAKDLGLETPEAQAAAPGQSGPDGPAMISSQEQYQALPSGSTYIDGSGKLKRKP
jgi:hypothetical protein